MTLQQLSRYYELRKRLVRYEETLESLRTAASSMTPTLSDMPKSPGPQDKLANIVAQIVDLERATEELLEETEYERHNAEAYISGIEDAYIKTIFSLHFVGCMSWAEVADAVGGGNTESSVRMVCYRYIS